MVSPKRWLPLSERKRKRNRSRPQHSFNFQVLRRQSQFRHTRLRACIECHVDEWAAIRSGGRGFAGGNRRSLLRNNLDHVETLLRKLA